MIPDESNEGALKPSASFIRRELEDIAKNEAHEFPSVSVIEFEELIDSSDMSVELWGNLLYKDSYLV